jgi:hypothetical protein
MRIHHEADECPPGVNPEEWDKWHPVAVDMRKALPQPMPRKVIKQTVMTTVYGVTVYGAKKQIKRQLLYLGIEREVGSI